MTPQVDYRIPVILTGLAFGGLGMGLPRNGYPDWVIGMVFGIGIGLQLLGLSLGRWTIRDR